MKGFMAGCAIAFLVLAGAERFHGQTQPDSDPVLRAMSDEMERSVRELQFRDLDRPYFIQYVILDQDQYRGEATFGALTTSDRDRRRLLQVQVRVGDYEFDNTEFVGSGAFQAPPNGVQTTIVLDNDYDSIRYSIWLATDSAYKQAVEQLARKRAFIENKTRDERAPDFSREEPATAIEPAQTLTVDQARWEKQLRDWSMIFRNYPDVHQSTVALRAIASNRYLVNSEGSRVRQPSLVVSLEAAAATQAPDGMRLAHSVPFNARAFDELPSAEEVTTAIRALAADVTALRASPVLDNDYSGPVLLAGSASAEMFARVLAPNLAGQRPPMFERDLQGSSGRSELTDRMNRSVLPSSMSVYDDPMARRNGERSLIGHYAVDDQGVPARRVSLVERGILKNFLMSRRPGKQFSQSNGHGRSGTPGRETPQIGNLFIHSEQGRSFEELKQELIRICKTETLDYGILIRAVDSDGRGPIGNPVLIYKVHVADGREELIRGVSASGVTVRSLRQIEAVGNDSFVANRLSGGLGVIASSIVAPSVLLDEMDLKRPTGAQQKPAILTHPYFNKIPQ